MCENLAKNINVTNISSLGHLKFNATDCLTSVGIFNPLSPPNDVGFGVSTVKMSKNGSVIVTGAYNNDTLFASNRPGLQIYLKKSGVKSGTCSIKEWWQQYQSILLDDENNLLQITEIAISDDGSSIVALGGYYEPNRIWVFEEVNRCTTEAKWVLQQKLTNTDENIRWDAISLDDKHTRMILKKFNKGSGSANDENVFCIYDRVRAQKKCKNFTELIDGYKFTLREQIPFTEIGSCLTDKFALSHDGQTIVFLVCLNAVFFVVVFEFNCEENVFIFVNSFQLSPKSKTIVDDVKFGGSCSEKLFIVTHTTGNDHTVEVHSRLPLVKGCCKKHSHDCCPKLRLFSLDTLVTVIENVSATTATNYTAYLVADPANGNSFVFVQTAPRVSNAVVPFIAQPLFLQLFRESGNPTVWCKCELNFGKLFRTNRYYQAQEFDMLSFDDKCNRFCYPINERYSTVSFTSNTFKEIAVTGSLDGNFYLKVQNEVPTTQEIYYRVEGDTEYTLFVRDTLFLETRQKIEFNEKTCKAKNIELVVVNGPTPVNPLADPTLIIDQAVIPIKTCFDVICFEKL